MRTELKALQKTTGQFHIGDFHDIFALAKRLDEAHVDRLIKIQQQLDAKSQDVVYDIMDDLFWYGHLESFVIWHFALCRLQSVLEGYISRNILKSPSKVGGIIQKLKQLKKKGFIISKDNLKALKEWAMIRNALTHSPPSLHQHGILQVTDVEEYLLLCVNVTNDLESQINAQQKIL